MQCANVRGGERWQRSSVHSGWGSPITGREQQSLKVFGEGIAYWTRMQQEGAIESFEAFQLEPHGGDLAGFCVLRGDAGRLAQMRVSEEFQRLNSRAQLVVTNFGVVGAITGEADLIRYANRLNISLLSWLVIRG
ncbi:MAG: hypothetical protein U0232_13160 [Thermomicrobiales bacterium]